MPNEDTGLQTDELASILEDGGDEAEVETQVEVEDPEPEDINHQVSLSQGEDELDEEVEEKDTPEKDDSGEEKDDEIIEEDGEGKDKLDAQIPHYQEIKAKYPTL